MLHANTYSITNNYLGSWNDKKTKILYMMEMQNDKTVQYASISADEGRSLF